MIFRREYVNRNSIKEAFDNLQSGACYFNQNGSVILCNHVMNEIGFDLMGKDIQYEKELSDAIEKLDEKILEASNGRFYEFHINPITGIGNEYIASDITELHQENKLLEARNAELAEVIDNINEMNHNIVAIAREEEILSLKMRIHSDMGRDILRIHKYLSEGCQPESKDELVQQLRRTVAMLQGGSISEEAYDSLEELKQAAKAIGTDIQISGQLPSDYYVLQTIVLAIRECLTNTVRHARGNSVTASIDATDDRYEVQITNNGIAPEDEIKEGGGLTGLRHRVENGGGTMTVQSIPDFKLMISIPQKGVGR